MSNETELDKITAERDKFRTALERCLELATTQWVSYRAPGKGRHGYEGSCLMEIKEVASTALETGKADA